MAKARDVLQTQDPTTAAGRRQIINGVTRSGPVARVDTDPCARRDSGIRRKWQLEGWHFEVFVSIIAVTICLVAELIMLVCAVVLNKPQGNQHGVGVLYVGSCAKVERMITILAIPINILATILVATSNYVMQCLSAPSKKDVDEAHAARSYLNIGISSIHNLVYNFSWKSVLWLVLFLTTVPIHLFLNSAFFGALQATNYGVMITTSGWETEMLANPSGGPNVDFGTLIGLQRVKLNGTVGLSLDGDFAATMWERSTASQM